jgi:hypothetical protein
VFAGIDTSNEAVMAYVNCVFDKIKSNSDQFLHAFLTPVYVDPLRELESLRTSNFDFEQTSSSILNV